MEPQGTHDVPESNWPAAVGFAQGSQAVHEPEYAYLPHLRAPEALKRALECAQAANSDPQLSHVRHCRAYSPALRPGPALRARQ